MRYIGFRVSSLVAATTYSLVTGRVSLIRASRARTTSLGFTRLLAVTMSTTAKTSSNATSQPSTIAVGQVCSTSNKISNLQQIAQCAGWAKSKHATMLFLPEACGFIGENAQQTFQNAELPQSLDETAGTTTEAKTAASLPDSLTKFLETTVQECANEHATSATREISLPTQFDDLATQSADLSVLKGLQVIAKTSQLWISVGGLHVQVDDSSIDKVYNTHLILDPSGTIKALYRKIHLFDVSIPGKVQLKESNSTAPGREVVLCDTPIGKLGLTTCYDMRFPELYKQLTEKGAQILLVPSAFTVPTGQAHWHILLRARAIENQAFVIASAQYGKHNHKRKLWSLASGRSMGSGIGRCRRSGFSRPRKGPGT